MSKYVVSGREVNVGDKIQFLVPLRSLFTGQTFEVQSGIVHEKHDEREYYYPVWLFDAA